ncbi:MAG TPA: 50S ribosomal protein L24 [Bacteroidota bacterium]|nr:50S ribosomal protein L24 [Bacteroidota bacterium]
MSIQKNDTVMVVAGNSRGKTGKVLKVYREDRRAIIEGVNIIKRHTRASQKNPQGGIVQKEEAIHVANVMVVCPKCGKPSRLGRRQITDSVSGRKQTMRVCKKCEHMF